MATARPPAEYVQDQIIVKFSEQAAKNLHQKLKSGQSPSELRLSGQSQRRVKLSVQISSEDAEIPKLLEIRTSHC
ncbi:MAG: S8 family serine peptidase [Planctomycetota bacterium]